MAYRPVALPARIPGEDRSYGSGLFVDLIPRTSWFTNVRVAVDPADWDRLRRMVYRRAGHRCEACGTRRYRLEAHERFTYDAQAGIQRLVRLICLCEWCHTTTHMGMAGVRGVRGHALAHLMAVTGMTPSQADAHVAEAFAVWERRSRIAWRVDLSMIAAAGIRLRAAPGRRPAQRSGRADARIRPEPGSAPSPARPLTISGRPKPPALGSRWERWLETGER